MSLQGGRSSRSRRLRAVLWLLLVIGVAGGTYLATLYPGVGGRVNPGDSIKFQYIGAILGVPHEPGYPQYVLLNGLWSRLPLPGELAWRVNLLSAVLMTLAGGLLWWALRRAGLQGGVAALTCLTFLLATPVWTFATEAEVHALQMVWACGALLAVVHWLRRRTNASLLIAVAVVAFSFGNHPFAVASCVGLAAVIVCVEPRALLRPRLLAAGAGFAVAALLQYGFLLLRSWQGARFLEAVPERAGLRDLWLGMSGSRFVNWHLGSDTHGTALEVMADLGRAALAELPVVAVVLGFAGVVLALRRQRGLAAWGLGSLLAAGTFYVVYRVPDPMPYRAYVWLPWVVLAGYALQQLKPRWQGALAAAWAVGLLLGSIQGYRNLNLPTSPFDRRALVAAAPGGSTLLLRDRDALDYPIAQLAHYYDFVDGLGRRPDVRVRAARRSIEEFAFLDARPMVFADPEIRGWLGAVGIDTARTGLPSGDGRTLFRSIATPANTVEVLPRERGLELRVDGEAAIDARKGLAVVAFDLQRQRRVASFELLWEGTPETVDSIVSALRATTEGVGLCFVLQGDPRRVERLLGALSAEAALAGGLPSSAVLTARMDISANWLQLLGDPGKLTAPPARYFTRLPLDS